VNIRRRQKIVLLGMMSKMPVAGVVWQTLHYLIGFRRLGFDVYYIEAHGVAPAMFIANGDGSDDGSARVAAFLADVFGRFDLDDRWAFLALHSDGRCYGMSDGVLARLYDSAEAIVNLHGGTRPLPEHRASDRLIYLETDPVAVQIQVAEGRAETLALLEPHGAFFTFGENLGNPDCPLPASDRFMFRATRQPVVLDFWRDASCTEPGSKFTTIGSWRQPQRQITYRGETYPWSKHHEFLKVLDLPSRVDQPFELALCKYHEEDRRLLEANGWLVRDSLEFSCDLDAYRGYIAESRGEFTVAKDQNVRFRSGWFSDRSATYLASGRPVITQETGFSANLPTGEGLFMFSQLDEILAAVDAIRTDYARHRRAALEIAHEFFDSDLVLSRLLGEIGVSHRSPSLAR
jgi:hypothetical protein